MTNEEQIELDLLTLGEAYAIDGQRVDPARVARQCLTKEAEPDERRRYVVALAVGSSVVVGNDIPGLVTGILVDSDGLQYKVAWWAGSDRKSEWLTAAEVRCESAQTVRIGFAQSATRKPRTPLPKDYAVEVAPKDQPVTWC